MFNLLAIVCILNHGIVELIVFVTNIIFVIGFQLLRSHLWFNNQLTIYIVGSSNYVPSTFDVPMFKDHESIVNVVDNEKRKQVEYDAHCKF